MDVLVGKLDANGNQILQQGSENKLEKFQNYSTNLQFLTREGKSHNEKDISFYIFNPTSDFRALSTQRLHSVSGLYAIEFTRRSKSPFR